MTGGGQTAAPSNHLIHAGWRDEGLGWPNHSTVKPPHPRRLARRGTEGGQTAAPSNHPATTTMIGMSTSPNRFPHVTAFPNALGTGMIISSSQPIDDELREMMATAIESFEAKFSRFRDESLVGRIARARYGGDFVFPDPQTAESLFVLYDRLFAASGGAIDPTVGEELTRLGYDARLTFRLDHEPEYQPDHDDLDPHDSDDTANPDADRAGRPARITWDSITHTGGMISTTRPLQLDFGAAGKGMMVDLLARMIERELPGAEYVVDAGGDLRVRSASPIRVALEDPDDPSRAVGVAEIGSGSFCASAPSRRHWRVRSAEGAVAEVHHLLNALDGRPANEVRATWVYVPMPCKPTGYEPTGYEPSRASAAGAPTAHTPDPAQTSSVPNTGDSAGTGVEVKQCPLRDSAGDSMNDECSAAWRPAAEYPTALADGLATALFVTDPAALADLFTNAMGTPCFQCALVQADRTVAASPSFPADFFTA